MVTVGSTADFERALANATANTTIVLRNGTYQKSGTFEIRRDGNSGAPIRIVAQNHLGATIRAEYLLLSGVHIQVSGLRFDNSRVIINRDNCRLSNCSFSGSNGRASVDGAANVVINNNEFRGWGDRCIAFNPMTNGSGRNPHIHSNYFRDSSNVAIAVGFQPAHQMLRVSALIERNLFVNCTHDQVVNFKSSNNRARQNTMVGSGAFVSRFGVDNSFENNWCENSKGIWLTDRNCTASGNRLNGSEILVLAGNVTSEQIRSVNNGHARAESARLINNAAQRTTIGVAWNGFNLPAINTVVEGHNGRVDRSREQGTTIGSTSNSSAGSGASRLQPSDVGPVASNVTVPAEPTASNQAPAPTEPPPPSQTQTPPTNTASNPPASDPPATNTSSPSLNTSSFNTLAQGSNQSGSSPFTLSRQPIFSQSTTPTTAAPSPTLGTPLSQQFSLSGSLFGSR
jgi:hypothetical protein